MLGDMGKMMKQLSDMKSQMGKVEKELKNTIITKSDKDNLFTIELTGKLDLKNVTINEDVLTSDIKKLEIALTNALSLALKEAQNMAANKLKEAGGLNIPGLS